MSKTNDCERKQQLNTEKSKNKFVINELCFCLMQLIQCEQHGKTKHE